MSEELIKKSDAIEAIELVDWYHQNRNKDIVSGASREHQAWYKAEDIYKALEAVPTIEPKTKVIAQVTFDEEKLREIVKGAVERFKEEYEIEPKQGEWAERTHNTLIAQVNFAYCSECGQPIMHEHTRPLWNFCPNCGADMRGKDDE